MFQLMSWKLDEYDIPHILQEFYHSVFQLMANDQPLGRPLSSLKHLVLTPMLSEGASFLCFLGAFGCFTARLENFISPVSPGPAPQYLEQEFCWTTTSVHKSTIPHHHAGLHGLGRRPCRTYPWRWHLRLGIFVRP